MNIPIRLIIAILGAYSTAMLATHQSAINIALVSMVESPIDEETSGGSCIETINNTKNYESYSNEYEKVESSNSSKSFDWSHSTQSIILSGSYYLYLIIPPVAGRLTERFGAKWILAFGVLFPAVITALTPVAANVGAGLVIVIRVLIGAGNGCIMSTNFALFTNWFPDNEKPIALTSLMGGYCVGLVMTFPLMGYLSSVEFAHGWPLVFYMTTLLNVPWAIGWLIYGANSPSDSKRISMKELEYISSNCVASGGPKKSVKAPWRAIVTSPPVYASIIMNTTTDFTHFLLLSSITRYLDSVYGLHISHNGLYSALIYLAYSISTMTGGPLSNYFRQKNLVSLTRLRKTFGHVSHIGIAICLIIIPQLGCNTIAVISMVVVGQCFVGMNTGGEWPIISEFAPDFVGTIFGIVNIFSTSTGFLAPLIVGAIIDEQPADREKWNIVFYMTAAISAFGALIFELFTTAEPQSWGIVSMDNEVLTDYSNNGDTNINKHHLNISNISIEENDLNK